MEADGLRWSLLIIGSLVIVGLAVHGIWISRKNSEKKSKANKLEMSNSISLQDGNQTLISLTTLVTK